MSDWPAISGPGSIEAEDLKAIIKHDFEAGYVQSRAQATVLKQRWTLTWNTITAADLALLRSHFSSYAGASFTWINPENATQYTVRFGEGKLPRRWIGPGIYSVSCILEEV